MLSKLPFFQPGNGMNSPERPRFKWLVLIALLLTMVASLSAAGSAVAHPGGPAHHNPLPEHATDVMRAFWVDHHAPQDLQALNTTACAGGFADAYPCNNVDLEAFLPLNQIGGTSSQSAANDIWGWTDSLTGKEYAIVGLVFGTSFVDISDPANPIYLGELPTHGAFGSSWRDIKTYADHAFIVSEANQHGMQVFDLTQLRNVTNPPVTFSETAHYNKNASAHNIVINEDSGYAYIVGAAGKNNCSGGLHMVNIQNPTNPSFAGCFSSDGYTHDAQCVNYSGPDADHQGKEICINSNEDTVTIVDVTNKSNPVQLSRTGYGGSEYTHQGWLTEDQIYFLLDDELDESNLGHNTRTRVWDVSDLDNPSLVGFFDNSTPSIDHNQYVKGNFSYQANYRSGLRILDITDVANGNLSEVAFFDIYPADDAARFNAAWSNYPYFDSGIVVVSGIEQGLFILRPNLGPVDNPPTVNVTDPAEGATVSGLSILVAATASDDNGVTQVEFFVDGNSIGVDTASPYSINWDSTTVPDGAHVISAAATDTVGQTGSDSNNVIIDNVADPTMHVGDLDGSSAAGGRGGKWTATATITVHDSSDALVANATVNGSWSAGANGAGSCVTNGFGQCSITKNNISRNSTSVTLTVDSVTHASLVYAAGDNHDPDGDSNGTVIVILKP
ncbi:MAG: choice-of-anchor B family protein [Chloroflexota bacterium]|nr:MAG: choice-of-anchor B family protein [Chloroflexota bacterium]